MSTYKLVTVHDWYDSQRSTRIRCYVVAGSYFCSRRQKLDAMRLASVMPGSILRSSDLPVYVIDDEGHVVDIIEGC